MSNREHLLSLAVATALVAFTGAARADGFLQPLAEPAGHSEERAEPVTCAQARADAWFMHELERSDGDAYAAAQPGDCQADVVSTAVSDDADASAYEESK